MRKLVKLLLVMVVAIIVVGVVTKMNVSADSTEVSKASEEATNKEGYRAGTSSYYIQFEKLAYNVYCKGHNVPHILEYSVNGGEKVTDRLMSEGQHIFCGIPKYIVYYYEFPNVQPGDVIEYTYSYTYTYGGFPEERVTPGTLVVE